MQVQERHQRRSTTAKWVSASADLHLRKDPLSPRPSATRRVRDGTHGGLTHLTASQSHIATKTARAPGVCTTAPIPVFPTHLVRSEDPFKGSSIPSPRKVKGVKGRVSTKQGAAPPRSPARRVPPPSPGRAHLTAASNTDMAGAHRRTMSPNAQSGIMAAMHRTAVTVPALGMPDVPPAASTVNVAPPSPQPADRADFVMGSAQPQEPAVVQMDSPRKLRRLQEVDVIYKHKPQVARGSSPVRRRVRGEKRDRDITIQALTPTLEQTVNDAHKNGTLACLQLFDLRSFSYAKGCPSSVISCKVALAGWISELLERQGHVTDAVAKVESRERDVEVAVDNEKKSPARREKERKQLEEEKRAQAERDEQDAVEDLPAEADAEAHTQSPAPTDEVDAVPNGIEGECDTAGDEEEDAQDDAEPTPTPNAVQEDPEQPENEAANDAEEEEQECY